MIPIKVPMQGGKPQPVSQTVKAWGMELAERAKGEAAKHLKVGEHGAAPSGSGPIGPASSGPADSPTFRHAGRSASETPTETYRGSDASAGNVGRHSEGPPGFDHVVRRLGGGVDAHTVAWAMHQAEEENAQRHAQALESIDFVPGCYPRNLKILDGIAAGQYRADREVINRAADDALSDLSRSFAKGDVVGDAWRHVLQDARYDALGAGGARSIMRHTHRPEILMKHVLSGQSAVTDKRVAPAQARGTLPRHPFLPDSAIDARKSALPFGAEPEQKHDPLDFSKLGKHNADGTGENAADEPTYIDGEKGRDRMDPDKDKIAGLDPDKHFIERIDELNRNAMPLDPTADMIAAGRGPANKKDLKQWGRGTNQPSRPQTGRPLEPFMNAVPHLHPPQGAMQPKIRGMPAAFDAHEGTQQHADDDFMDRLTACDEVIDRHSHPPVGRPIPSPAQIRSIGDQNATIANPNSMFPDRIQDPRAFTAMRDATKRAQETGDQAIARNRPVQTHEEALQNPVLRGAAAAARKAAPPRHGFA